MQASNQKNAYAEQSRKSWKTYVLFCDSYPHVRATVFYGGDEELIKLSRQHNDANVLSIGARFVTFDTLTRVLACWLTEPFSADPKYDRRNQKIERLTKDI